jgi:hypothetical protein
MAAKLGAKPGTTTQNKAKRTNEIDFLSRLCKQGVAGSIPVTSTNRLPAISITHSFVLRRTSSKLGPADFRTTRCLASERARFAPGPTSIVGPGFHDKERFDLLHLRLG